MDEPVYTTGKGRNKPQKKRKSVLPQAGPTKMRLERKGRGGKQVTVLFNLPYSETEAQVLMKNLKNALGCGAALKNGQIELQGDVRERVAKVFAARNEKLVPAGG